VNSNLPAPREDDPATRRAVPVRCEPPVELTRLLATLFIVIGAAMLRHAASPEPLAALAFAFVGFAGVLLSASPRALRRLVSGVRFGRTSARSSLPKRPHRGIERLQCAGSIVEALAPTRSQTPGNEVTKFAGQRFEVADRGVLSCVESGRCRSQG